MNPALVSQSPLVAQSLQYWFVSSHTEPSVVGASVVASVDSSVVVFVVVVGTVHTLQDFLQDRSMNPALVPQSPLVAQSLQYWFLSSHTEPTVVVGASVVASVDSSVVVFVVVVGTVHTLHDFLQDRSMNPALVSQSPLVAQSLQYWFLSSHIEP